MIELMYIGRRAPGANSHKDHVDPIMGIDHGTRMCKTNITIVRAERPLGVGRSLTSSALRYGLPIVMEAQGWAGEIQIDPSRPTRGGMCAMGTVSTGARVVEVVAVELVERAGGDLFEVVAHIRSGDPIRGTVRVAVGVAPLNEG